jgi:RNA methyltransferase, TrmH family
MTLITSPANARISKVQALHTSRGRKKQDLFLMEGPHLLIALLDARLWPREVYYQPALLQRSEDGVALFDRLVHLPDEAKTELIEVSERVMDALSDVQTSQGVVCVLPLNLFDPAVLAARRDRLTNRKRPCLLILDAIADPGNMGTILRTALAADVASVLLAPHCVDYFSSKVVRAAAGAHVALPVEPNLEWSEIAERIAIHCDSSPRVLLAEADASVSYYDQDLTQPFALIMGNEAHGPSGDARAMATLLTSIPLANGVESLNVAMATGIILYEMVRQARTTK